MVGGQLWAAPVQTGGAGPGIPVFLDSLLTMHPGDPPREGGTGLLVCREPPATVQQRRAVLEVLPCIPQTPTGRAPTREFHPGPSGCWPSPTCPPDLFAPSKRLTPHNTPTPHHHYHHLPSSADVWPYQLLCPSAGPQGLPEIQE